MKLEDFSNSDFQQALKRNIRTLTHGKTVSEHPKAILLGGQSGAGKTTITNLINRFYDIADGKIRYDGININKIKKSDK